MARYHIKDDGNPGICKAAEGKCPKGGAHFDNESDAREAVEKLFGGAFQAAPEPLAVYTKTAVKRQFSHLWDAKTGYAAWRRKPAFSYGSDHVREVFAMLTESRLDVKSQNLKVREALDAKLTSLKTMRDSGSEAEKLEAAVALHYLSDILEEDYSIADTRSEKQKAADRDFVNSYTSEYDAIPGDSDFSKANVRIDEWTEDNLKTLAAYEGRDEASFTDEELATIHKLNKQAQSTERRWRFGNEQMDSLAYYHASKARKVKADTVPSEMQQYLIDDMKSSKLQDEIESARHEILSLAPRSTGGFGGLRYSEATPISEVAGDILAARDDNELLRQHVLKA